MGLGVYTVEKPFGSNKPGDRIEYDQDEAKDLMECGLLSEAEPLDNDGDEDDIVDEAEEVEDAEDVRNPERAALVARSMSKLNKSIEASIAKGISLAMSKQSKPAITIPATPKQPVFKSFGDMLRAQYRAKALNDISAKRQLNAYQSELKVKSPLGMNEGTNSQGGYGVIPEWYDRIWDKARDYPHLKDMTDVRTVGKTNTLNIPAFNETSLVDGSRHAGVLAYYVGEGNPATSSYPAETQVQAVLNTLVVLVYVSNQLLEDASYPIEDDVARLVGNEFVWQQNVGVCTGSGSSQPLGIMNQNALVTVAKETSQGTVSTGQGILFPNLCKMFTRLYPVSRGRATWLVNPEMWSALNRMTFPGDVANSNLGSYSAFGGITYTAHDEFPLRIFGRPVVECMNLNQFGTAGDIILADLSQLVTIEHASGLDVAVSDQIQFTTLQTAFRFVYRWDVRSPWTAALTPFDGTTANSYSPFVTLAARGT